MVAGPAGSRPALASDSGRMGSNVRKGWNSGPQLAGRAMAEYVPARDMKAWRPESLSSRGMKTTAVAEAVARGAGAAASVAARRSESINPGESSHAPTLSSQTSGAAAAARHIFGAGMGASPSLG